MTLKLLKPLFILSLSALLLTACGANLPFGQSDEVVPPTATRVVAVVPLDPTATNFPQIGTPTPVPPTPTPGPTNTAVPRANTNFDDATLEELMAGTIGSAGVAAQVEIVDERASGGERIAYVQIGTEQDLSGSNLLLKLFVLEVGNALRSIRAFSEGTLNADLDGVFVTVVDQSEESVGTVQASMADIIAFLDGQSNVDQTLDRIEVTGVFEDFKR